VYRSTQVRPGISTFAAVRASTSQFQRNVEFAWMTSLSSKRIDQIPGTEVSPLARHCEPFGAAALKWHVCCTAPAGSVMMKSAAWLASPAVCTKL
jgi:hypothetical protein